MAGGIRAAGRGGSEGRVRRPPGPAALRSLIDKLPKEARDYVLYLAEGAGVPVSYVGVGPERLQTVAL